MTEIVSYMVSMVVLLIGAWSQLDSWIVGLLVFGGTILICAALVLAFWAGEAHERKDEDECVEWKWLARAAAFMGIVVFGVAAIVMLP